MPPTVRLLPGLPPYGDLATSFPQRWAIREGVVVEFVSDEGTWVGNFEPGYGRIKLVDVHPNKRDAIVVAGDLWSVDLSRRAAELLVPFVDDMLPGHDPDGWIVSRQSLALARLGPSGLLWHTRRLSWDGFDQLRVQEDRVLGDAWSPIDDSWHPFEVDARTGRADGGSFDSEDTEAWEMLAK